MNKTQKNRAILIEKLNQILAWEKRAEAMYSHYAAYVKGLHRLHLKPFFEGEANESTLHARQVREAIVHLGGVAITEQDPTAIKHTTNYREMLAEALETEKRAGAGYAGLLEHIDENDELYDVLQQIHFAEERSLIELNHLLDG
ncbi:ferritin-like domain-containing protein [Myxococcota bacterium]|nr:ferritin-like domain-containing protein [Myxococcota bacterium]